MVILDSLDDLDNRTTLTFHGYFTPNLNFGSAGMCTRLLDRIIEKVPGLIEFKDSRNIVLCMDNDIGRTLFLNCENTKDKERMILNRLEI